VEWKGVVRAAGDEVAPIDLRIDHVYLVSCKYMSNILFNVSPAHVFDSLLAGGPVRRGRGVGGDWYAEVAPLQYQRLYETVRAAVRDEGIGHAIGRRATFPRHDGWADPSRFRGSSWPSRLNPTATSPSRRPSYENSRSGPSI
jgi:hypothetical protein